MTANALGFDPRIAVAALRKADPTLGQVIRQAGPCTLAPEKMHSPFEALARAIVYQQLSGKAAATIMGRVRALAPGRNGFRPPAVLALDDQALRQAGMSRAKVAAIKDLAAKAHAGEVPTLARLRRMSDAEIVESLTRIRGIGPWSAEMLLIFRLGRPDVLPISDLGVRQGFKLTYGLSEMPAPAELVAHAERWRPYRSVASWYMWRAVDLARTAAKAAGAE